MCVRLVDMECMFGCVCMVDVLSVCDGVVVMGIVYISCMNTVSIALNRVTVNC